MKPTTRPRNPMFSSGPCAKRPGWSLEALQDACVGRSHRSKAGKAKLREVIDRSRDILGLPNDYRIGIVPASDTGAFEMSMWCMLGVRGVDALAWESFGKGWVTDITKQLKLDDVRTFEAPYGELPDLSVVDCDRDVVFTWNGTTSGVRVPNGDWIKSDRKGLTFCDATSAAFAMELPWSKLDVTTYSWQKVLGGEAAHGMLILSPRAVERLERYTPPWPLPKIFRMTKSGKLIEGIFEGATINTPSMLATEDAIDALKWVKENGGHKGMIERTNANLEVVSQWVEATDWVSFLAKDAAVRSPTSICLSIVAQKFVSMSPEEQSKTAKKMVTMLDEEGVAKDIGSYRDAPSGLRLWGGGMVEKENLSALMPWLDWAYAESIGS